MGTRRVGEQRRKGGEEEGNEVKGTHSAVRDQRCELRRVEGRLYLQGAMSLYSHVRYEESKRRKPGEKGGKEKGRNKPGIRTAPAWR
jgi:hypothetical protein